MPFWKIIYKKGRYLTKIIFTLSGYMHRCLDLFRIPFYDVVYVHLWVTPFGPPLFERLVRLLSRRLVYDIDDMIYLDTTKSKANPLISDLKGKNKPIYLFKKSDAVLTSTPAIEEFASTLTNKVVQIPITIDTDLYSPKKKYITDTKLIIGWTGSLSTSPYLHLLDAVLQQLTKEYDFLLLVMGDPDFRLDGVDVKAIPWQAEYEVDVIRSFDIGLYPLPEEQWVHGKGGGKALQYMSLGVPTVATAIGANFKIITNEANGFLVNTDEEWKTILSRLMVDAGLRESIGQKAVETVKEKFSVLANKEKYLSLLQK